MTRIGVLMDQYGSSISSILKSQGDADILFWTAFSPLETT
jgi:hypothetical protein